LRPTIRLIRDCGRQTVTPSCLPARATAPSPPSTAALPKTPLKLGCGCGPIAFVIIRRGHTPHPRRRRCKCSDGGATPRARRWRPSVMDHFKSTPSAQTTAGHGNILVRGTVAAKRHTQMRARRALAIS
jgi:hypothetical protein